MSLFTEGMADQHKHHPLHHTAFQVALAGLLQIEVGAWRLPHQISNFTPFSGMVFVKNAAPMVDSCRHMSDLLWHFMLRSIRHTDTHLCPMESLLYISRMRECGWTSSEGEVFTCGPSASYIMALVSLCQG